VRVPCSGVNSHSSGLVNADYVVVFVEDVERYRLRFGDQRRTGLGIDLNEIAGADFLGIFGGLAVQENQTLFDEFLDTGAGEVGAMRGDNSVKTKTSVGVGDGNGELRGIGHG
jgi:hypothetical protein